MAKSTGREFDVSAKITTNHGAQVWMKLGKAWELDNGSFSLSIITWPVNERSWDGGLMMFPKED